jgi:hypothetical protein
VRIYCTYFDSGYLSRGLALISSLRESGEASLVLVVAFDDIAFEYLNARKSDLGLIVRKSSDLLAKFPELARVSGARKYSELFFTSSPFLVKLAMEEVSPGALVIYLDADLFFFESPDTVFTDLGNGSVGIIEHNYPKSRQRLASKYGTFNVGMVIFRNDQQGQLVLNWWAARCIEWCHDYPLDGKYADQGYLDHFPRLSPQTVILKNPGFNLAPWNTSSSTLSTDQHKVLVNNQPLVFFHFHGLTRMGGSFVSGQLTYWSPLGRSVFQAIYKPYVKALDLIEQKLQEEAVVPYQAAKRGVGLRGLLFAIYKKILSLLSVVMGQAIQIRKSR